MSSELPYVCKSCGKEPRFPFSSENGKNCAYGENCIESILEPKTSGILKLYNRFRKRL